MRAAFLATVIPATATAEALDYSKWHETYVEEFESPEAIEQFDTRYIWARDTIINNESQYYLDPDEHGQSPFVVEGGVLSIVASPTPETLVEQVKEQPYVSGLLTSRSDSHSQLYGLFEVRAKLPKAEGAWPAFWLLPTFEQWPAGIGVLPEIDVMEGIKRVEDGRYAVSLHTNQTGTLTSTSEKVKTGVDLTEDFHVYGVAWQADEIVYYFDGDEVWRQPTPADMHEPRHFLLNLAVGGWAGEPNAEDYPASFDIDYVRVYERVEEPEPVSATGDTPLTFEGFIRILEHLRDVARGDTP